MKNDKCIFKGTYTIRNAGLKVILTTKVEQSIDETNSAVLMQRRKFEILKEFK